MPFSLAPQGIWAIRVPDSTGVCRPFLPDLAEDLADAAMQARTPNNS